MTQVAYHLNRCNPRASQLQVALGEIVVAVIEADLPPRTLERNGLGPFVPRSVRTQTHPAPH
jgi:hypothetical protein